MNSVLKTLLVIALVGAGLLFALLTIGAFGQVNPSVPGPVTLVKNLESLVSGAVGFLPGNGEKAAFGRGFTYMGLTIVFTSLAALLVAEPRSEQLTWPGRPASRKEA